MTVRPRVVVGAVIIEAGRDLAARRSRPSNLAGVWEFPGGKVEDDEEVSGDGAPWRVPEKYVLRLYLALVIHSDLVSREL